MLVILLTFMDMMMMKGGGVLPKSLPCPETNPYEKEMSKDTFNALQCTIKSLFGNLVKCLGRKH